MSTRKLYMVFDEDTVYNAIPFTCILNPYL